MYHLIFQTYVKVAICVVETTLEKTELFVFYIILYKDIHWNII